MWDNQSGEFVQRKRDISTWLGMTTARASVLSASVVASAGLMSLAIRQPSLWWLGWFALLPLFTVIRVCKPAVSGAFGALWGVSLFLCGAVAMSVITASPAVLAALTLVPAAYGFVGSKVTRSVGFSPYLLALGWIGVEVALGPFGLRHGLLAATQGDGALIHVFGSFAGYALVAFAVAYINASLVSALEEMKAWATGARFAPRSAAVALCHRIQDQFCVLIHLIRPAQARAPPVV